MPNAENTPGAPRNDDVADADLARDRDGMQRAGAAIGDQREVAGIEAALGGDALHRVGHGGRRRCAGCRRRPAVASMPSGSPTLASARSAASTSSFISPPRKRSAPSRPSTQIGVGDGRLLAAAAVAGRARHGAGALRADAQRAVLDPRDRAAAGADLENIHHRRSAPAAPCRSRRSAPRRWSAPRPCR